MILNFSKIKELRHLYSQLKKQTFVSKRLSALADGKLADAEIGIVYHG